MNGINSNVTNAHLNSVNGSNNKSSNEDSSIFEKALDYAKNLFSDDEDDASVSKHTSSYNKGSNNLDRAFLDTKMENASGRTYTLAPKKDELTLTEQWAKENESVIIRQKEKEIEKLKHALYTMKNKNRVLEQQNEEMAKQSVVEQGETIQKLKDQISGDEADQFLASLEAGEKKNYQENLPTHTSLPDSALKQQESAIHEAALAEPQAKAPQKSVSESEARKTSFEKKSEEEVATHNVANQSSDTIKG